MNSKRDYTYTIYNHSTSIFYRKVTPCPWRALPGATSEALDRTCTKWVCSCIVKILNWYVESTHTMQWRELDVSAGQSTRSPFQHTIWFWRSDGFELYSFTLYITHTGIPSSIHSSEMNKTLPPLAILFFSFFLSLWLR